MNEDDLKEFFDKHLKKILLIIFIFLFITSGAVAISSGFFGYRHMLLDQQAQLVESEFIRVYSEKTRKTGQAGRAYFAEFRYKNPERGWEQKQLLIDRHDFVFLQKEPSRFGIEAAKVEIPGFISSLSKLTRYKFLHDPVWAMRLKDKNHASAEILTTIVCSVISLLMLLLCFAVLRGKNHN